MSEDLSQLSEEERRKFEDDTKQVQALVLNQMVKKRGSILDTQDQVSKASSKARRPRANSNETIDAATLMKSLTLALQSRFHPAVEDFGFKKLQNIS